MTRRYAHVCSRCAHNHNRWDRPLFISDPAIFVVRRYHVALIQRDAQIGITSWNIECFGTYCKRSSCQTVQNCLAAIHIPTCHPGCPPMSMFSESKFISAAISFLWGSCNTEPITFFWCLTIAFLRAERRFGTSSNVTALEYDWFRSLMTCTWDRFTPLQSHAIGGRTDQGHSSKLWHFRHSSWAVGRGLWRIAKSRACNWTAVERQRTVSTVLCSTWKHWKNAVTEWPICHPFTPNPDIRIACGRKHDHDATPVKHRFSRVG